MSVGKHARPVHGQNSQDLNRQDERPVSYGRHSAVPYGENTLHGQDLERERRRQERERERRRQERMARKQEYARQDEIRQREQQELARQEEERQHKEYLKQQQRLLDERSQHERAQKLAANLPPVDAYEPADRYESNASYGIRDPRQYEETHRNSRSAANQPGAYAHELSQYRPENYRTKDQRKAKSVPKKRLTKGKKIAIGIGSGLAAIILIVGVGFGLYLNRLNNAINLGANADEINAALSASEFGAPYYVLLVGSDSREGAANSDYWWAQTSADGSDARADVIILARIDESNHQITLLTIPRDTPWQDSDGTYMKLNETYTWGGLPRLIDSVEEITDLPISHVVEIQMSGLIDLVDLLGGIEVDVPVTIDYHEALTSQYVHIDEGVQVLNGMQTEVYARERNVYTTGDHARQGAVRQIIEAILAKVKTKPVTELPGLVLTAAECVNTDMSALDLTNILTAMTGKSTLYQGSGPYDGAVNPAAGNKWLCYDNPDGWARVVAVVDSGGDPSTVTYENDAVFAVGSE